MSLPQCAPFGLTKTHSAAYSLLAIDTRRLRSCITTMVQVEHRTRHRTIALFDVDGTLSVARKVSTWRSAQTGIMLQLTL